MRQIEPTEPAHREDLTQEIQDFWARNVNAERIMGKDVTAASRGEDEYFAELQRQRFRSHRHLLPWINSMQAGRSVLEIGCGVGLDSFMIARRPLNLTAIDLTEVGVETAKARFKRNEIKGRFAVTDACTLPFQDNTFDYVYSFGVLHHVANTHKGVQEVRRVLKSGGEALIMLYNRHSLNEIVHRLCRVPFEDRQELCPVVRRFTTREVREMFGDFAGVEAHLDYVFGEGYGPVFKWTPDWLYRLLSRHVGWHIMIRATK